MNVITFLDADVTPERWDDVRRAYAQVTAAPTGVRPLVSYLIQQTDQPTKWRIVSVWQDMATLQAMRQSGAEPAGVTIFKAAGAMPSLSIFQVDSELQ